MEEDPEGLRAELFFAMGGLRRYKVIRLYLTLEEREGLRFYAAWPKWDPEGSRLWGRGMC